MYLVTYTIFLASGQQDMFSVKEANVGELLEHVRAVQLGADPQPPYNPHVLLDYEAVEYMRIVEFEEVSA